MAHVNTIDDILRAESNGLPLEQQYCAVRNACAADLTLIEDKRVSQWILRHVDWLHNGKAWALTDQYSLSGWPEIDLKPWLRT